MACSRPADLAPTAGQIDVRCPELPIDVAGGDAEGQKPVRIEGDPATEALDLRDAPDPL